MSSSPARKVRRLCKRFGHVPKHGKGGMYWCARWGLHLTVDEVTTR